MRRLRSPRSSLSLSLAFAVFIFPTLSYFAVDHSRIVHAESSGWGASRGNTIIAGVQFGTPPSSDGHDSSGCVWSLYFTYDNSGTPPPVDPPQVNEGGFTYELWQRECDWGREAIWIPNIDQGTLGEAASSRLWRMIPSLPFETAPPPDRMVVGVGSWFWVPAYLWQKISVTAWIPITSGTISATTEAEPRDLIFSPGDGSFGTGDIKCDGPGLRWLPFYGDSKPSSCMYTYKHSSSLSRDGLFHGSLTTVWEVSWHTNIGVGGSLPDIEGTSFVTVRVRELEALVR